MSSCDLLPAVYDAFSRDRLRLSFYCPHCVSDAEVAEFKATPLRERSWAQLEVLVCSALNTFGDAQDARHCLPRMVELSLRSAFKRDCVLQLAHRLPLSPPERALLNALFAEGVLAQLRADEPLDDVLALVTSYGLQQRVAALLEASPLAPRWYAQLICEFAQRQDRLSAQEAVLVDWVFTHPKLAALERAFFAATNAQNQQLFSSAVQVLEWF